MSSISIAGNSMPLSEASPDWIVQQIDRRRHDGMAVCVVVALQTAGLNMRLATPGCGGGGGGRLPARWWHSSSSSAIFFEPSGIKWRAMPAYEAWYPRGVDTGPPLGRISGQCAPYMPG